MDRAGGADAVTLARNIKQLSGRKVYIVAVWISPIGIH